MLKSKNFVGLRNFTFKKPGISLLVAMVGSSIALGVVTTIMISLSHSLEQAQNIERSTQVFFAVESGLEAGFFHHNARGQGTKFLPIGDPDFSEHQIISHEGVNLRTKWSIDGRAETNTVTGLIEEFKPLVMKWSWDNADSVEKDVDIVDQPLNFSLTIEEPAPGFDFGFTEIDDQVIANWMIARKHSSYGVNTLTPWAPDLEDLCNINSSFVCRYSLPFQISHADFDMGTLSPRIGTQTEMEISNFSSDPAASDHQIVITPLTSFTSSDGSVTVPGIPYTLIEGNGVLLPLPSYSVNTQVEALGFVKNLSVENIPEKTPASAFSYTIFD